MYDLIVKNGIVVDPINNRMGKFDVAVENGKIAEVSEEITQQAKKVIDATGKKVIPGIIDMHTHMRTVNGHPHAQRMLAMAGVCTTLDMAGPLANILDTIPGSGAGTNIAILEAAFYPDTLPQKRPTKEEQQALIDRSLQHGAIGVKMLGGHLPIDVDICESIITLCNQAKCWVAWHAGSTKHGSNIEGFQESVEAAHGQFLHVAHINSYCRGQITDVVKEAQIAIDVLKKNPCIYSESYLSPLNGTNLRIVDDKPYSHVTATCLRRLGYPETYEGMKNAILNGDAGVLFDNGLLGGLVYGKEGVKHWEECKTDIRGSFSVNPAASRFLLATAKRDNGAFVVDSFSTDGGAYPRNVIVENGLLLLKFGALTWPEFVVKTSINGAHALALPNKGHLSVGADGDISVIDEAKEKAYATIVAGKVIMLDGQLTGKGTCIICDERGADYLKSRGIDHCVKGPFKMEDITNRYIPKPIH